LFLSKIENSEKKIFYLLKYARKCRFFFYRIVKFWQTNFRPFLAVNFFGRNEWIFGRSGLPAKWANLFVSTLSLESPEPYWIHEKIKNILAKIFTVKHYFWPFWGRSNCSSNKWFLFFCDCKFIYFDFLYILGVGLDVSILCFMNAWNISSYVPSFFKNRKCFEELYVFFWIYVTIFLNMVYKLSTIILKT
jgi:hypothetical protein